MNEQFTRAPHHSERNSAPSPNAALLIDFDNVTMGIRSNLGQELRQLLNSDIIRGKVSVQRAYADWRRYPQYVVPLSEAAIDLIYAPAYGSSKKNATDIRLAIDALELVFTRPEIGSFILLSGDSDFSSLVLKLKEYGKYVIGVGMQESSSDLLVQNCDEYYSYDSLSGLVSADEMDTDRHDPWELAEHSIKKMVERDDVMRSDRLKQVMLELDPSFDEKEIGYSKFNRFLTEASSRGILTLEKIGNGQYEVGPGSSVDVEAPSGDGASGGGRDGGGRQAESSREREPARESAPSSGPERSSGGDGGGEERRGGEARGGSEKRRGGSAGGDRPVVEAEQLRAAYDLLREVVSDLSDDGGSVRDSEVKREMLNRDSSFDEGALGFSKFSRFIRQAHDEGVLDVSKDSDGNYYLTPPGGGEPASGRETASERSAAEEKHEPAREPEPGREPESGGQEPARDEEESDGGSEPPRREPREEAGREAEAASADADAAGESADEDGGEEPAGEPGGRSGIGLRRRGRSAPDQGGSGSDDSWVPGPVDSGGGDGGGTPSAGGGSDAAAGGGGGSDAAGTSRRGVGRFRRGRKSGKPGEKEEDSEKGPAIGPVDEPAGSGSPASEGGGEPSAEGGSESPPDSSPGEASGEAERATAPHPSGPVGREGEGDGSRSQRAQEIVDHMTESYSGVGVKTARKLVDEFGERTLEVIDEEPRRVEQVLPKHRAEAVLQARAVEREQGGGSPGGRG